MRWTSTFKNRLFILKRGILLISAKKEYKKQPEICAFVASLMVGFFIHLFGLVNVLHNHDDIFIKVLVLLKQALAGG